MSARYWLVLIALNAPLTSVISSFSGTSAMGASWFFAADSSSRACDVLSVPPCDRSGAMYGVQPSVGSRKKLISALSLPLTSVCAPASAATLAVLNCAVCPVAFSRYFDVTLSLGSWSIMVKLRVVGQARPATFVAVPVCGTASMPALMSWFAAAKNCWPLQNDTWPKIDPARPLMQLPSCSAAVPAALTRVRLVPLNPISIVTIAPAGNVGTTGAAAGVVPCVIVTIEIG